MDYYTKSRFTSRETQFKINRQRTQNENPVQTVHYHTAQLEYMSPITIGN